MCGRYSLFEANDKVLLERFHASHINGTFQKRYNIAPSQNVYAVLNEDPRAISTVKWGLVPFWAKDPAIGDRMPVILRREDEDKWLTEKGLTSTLGLLKPYDAKQMVAYEISPLINSPSNDGKEVVQPIC